MGIPDTFVMPIYDTQIFTATAEETSSSNSSTQEYMPPCTQIFRTALFNYKKDKDQPGPSVVDSSSVLLTCEDIMKATNIKKYTPAEIKKATGNYNKHNIIGRGGFATVYKGILPNNQLIAVKMLEVQHTAGVSKYIRKEFVNEVMLLSQINHKNVVKLLGCCFEKVASSIVYEFVPNRTLYEHLFDDQNPCVLTWNRRLRIGLQVAQVLEYLHNTRVPIIHRDIKSSNILLDDNFMAKVCDFGISKLGPCQDESNTFVKDAMECDGLTTCVQGTFGYLDPEYFETSRVTMKSDVYSFGVVLAELLTRKKANKSLASNYIEKLKDYCLLEILDEQLVNEGAMEQLMKVAHLAGRCLKLEGKDRPTMTQVVRELQDIGGF